MTGTRGDRTRRPAPAPAQMWARSGRAAPPAQAFSNRASASSQSGKCATTPASASAQAASSAARSAPGLGAVAGRQRVNRCPLEIARAGFQELRPGDRGDHRGHRLRHPRRVAVGPEREGLAPGAHRTSRISLLRGGERGDGLLVVERPGELQALVEPRRGLGAAGGDRPSGLAEPVAERQTGAAWCCGLGGLYRREQRRCRRAKAERAGHRGCAEDHRPPCRGLRRCRATRADAAVPGASSARVTRDPTASGVQVCGIYHIESEKCARNPGDHVAIDATQANTAVSSVCRSTTSTGCVTPAPERASGGQARAIAAV